MPKNYCGTLVCISSGSKDHVNMQSGWWKTKLTLHQYAPLYFYLSLCISIFHRLSWPLYTLIRFSSLGILSMHTRLPFCFLFFQDIHVVYCTPPLFYSSHNSMLCLTILYTSLYRTAPIFVFIYPYVSIRLFSFEFSQYTITRLIFCIHPCIPFQHLSSTYICIFYAASSHLFSSVYSIPPLIIFIHPCVTFQFLSSTNICMIHSASSHLYSSVCLISLLIINIQLYVPFHSLLSSYLCMFHSISVIVFYRLHPSDSQPAAGARLPSGKYFFS